MAISFDETAVRRILIASEGAALPQQARPVMGHTGARHSAVTNQFLYNRGGVATAFLDFRQAVEIGVKVLGKIPNPDVEAILDAREGTGAAKQQFLVFLDPPYKIRLNGLGTRLCPLFLIVLARNTRMPLGLMVVTFFPKMELGNKDFARIIY